MVERHLDACTLSVMQVRAGQTRQEQHIRHGMFTGLHMAAVDSGGGVQNVENFA